MRSLGKIRVNLYRRTPPLRIDSAVSAVSVSVDTVNFVPGIDPAVTVGKCCLDYVLVFSK